MQHTAKACAIGALLIPGKPRHDGTARDSPRLLYAGLVSALVDEVLATSVAASVLFCLSVLRPGLRRFVTVAVQGRGAIPGKSTWETGKS